MKRLHYFAVHIVLRMMPFMLLTACLTPIEVEEARVGNRMVISGQISTMPDRSFVTVGVTAEKDRLPFPVSDAQVYVVSNDNTYTFYSDPEKEGRYKTAFVGIPGQAYFLQVQLASGQTYTSKPETIPIAKAENDITLNFQKRDFVDGEGTVSSLPFVDIVTTLTLPAQQSYFAKWYVEEVFLITPTDFPDIFGYVPPSCYITQNAAPQQINLISGDEFNEPQISGFRIAERLIDRSFLEKHYFNVYHSSINRDAYDYWGKVNTLVSNVGSIFDPPPAVLQGNIVNSSDPEELVFGYFQATNEEMDRFVLYGADIPISIPAELCTYVPGKDPYSYAPVCLDCISARNSSYIRPPWF